jgi:hypothetical protein
MTSAVWIDPNEIRKFQRRGVKPSRFLELGHHLNKAAKKMPTIWQTLSSKQKKRWRRLPNLQGAARFGRLIYLVCIPKKIVYLIWIFTHAEFQEPYSQPPAKDLAMEVESAMQESLNEQNVDSTTAPETDLETDNSNQ